MTWAPGTESGVLALIGASGQELPLPGAEHARVQVVLLAELGTRAPGMEFTSTDFVT
jgi:hypothetical protein